MCSIGEDDFGDEGGVHAMKQMQPDTLENNDLKDVICKNCNTREAIVQLCFKEAQCKECFYLYVRHKFRATLGTTKIVRRGSNVLIDFDGSDNSLVLMHMIDYAMSQETYRKLHFNIFIMYVDENCVNDSEDAVRLIKSIKTVLEQFNFKFNYYASIADDESYVAINEINFDAYKSKESEFLKKFNDIRTLSLKQDFLRITRKNVLRSIANNLDCPYIFTSEISTDLAAIVLADVALGRGQSTAFDVAFVDDRTEDAKIIRPIRDLTQNEVNKYIQLTNIKTFGKCNFGRDKGEFSSIQNLTSNFVDGLQRNFSSTVSTVFRTGDKFSAIKVIPESQCTFCKALVDCENSETLHAISFSSKMSKNDENKEIPLLMQKLCHSCRNIFKDLS